jgi:hypothetical protein
VHADGLLIALQESRREFYIPCTMTFNNAEWERGWFYLRNDGAGLPLGREGADGEADSWHHGVSPSSHQARLDSLLSALKNLADVGLGAASVLANLHHRWIAPLMERELRIYEMSKAANPMSLACSRFLSERLPPEYAAMRARITISLKAVRHRNDDLWSFVMLPDAPAVSRLLSYGPPWAHCLDGYQDRLLIGPLGLPGLCHMAPDGVRRKDYGGEVLG